MWIYSSQSYLHNIIKLSKFLKNEIPVFFKPDEFAVIYSF